MINEQAITHFFKTVGDTHREIQNLPNKFFARAMLFSLIDALSRVAHPGLTKNRQRFVAAIDEYAQWVDVRRFSLRQMGLRLADVHNPSALPGFQALSQEVSSRLAKWPAQGTIVYPEDIDPTRDELRLFLNAELAKLLEPVRYPSLLWATRNSVVHELRNLGEGFDFGFNEMRPYYHSLFRADGITRTWEFYLPNGLLTQIATSMAANLEQRAMRDDVNPWDAFPSSEKLY